MQSPQEVSKQTSSRRQESWITNLIIYYYSFAICLGIMLEIYYINTATIKTYILRVIFEIVAISLLTLVQVKTIVSIMKLCITN